MKSRAFGLVALLAAGLAGGCAHLDLTPESDPQRLVTGTVNVRGEVLFPPEAEVTVRILDTSPLEHPPTSPLKLDTPGSSDRDKAQKVERVLGEQVIRAPGASPIPFRVEFPADDALMRRGVTLEARISYNGKVQYRNLEARVVTLASAGSSHEVWVEPVK